MLPRPLTASHSSTRPHMVPLSPRLAPRSLRPRPLHLRSCIPAHSPRRPAHTPTRLTLSVAESREVSREQSFEFPLPPPPKRALPFNYPGSQGFVYEAHAVHAALREGRLQCTEWTHAEAVTTQACVDALRGAVIARGT